MKSNGIIDCCKTSGCNWKCCDFGSKGHIVMLPTEYESAEGSVSHLEIINDNDNGGKHVKCIAKYKSNCDNGYKPIQCRTFPLFLSELSIGIGGSYLSTLRSMRFPLSNDVLELHAKRCKDIVIEFCKDKEIDFKPFFKEVKLNNYFPFYGKNAFVILDKNNVSDIMEYENSLLDDSLCMRSSNEDIAKALSGGCSVGVNVHGKIIAYTLCYVNEYGISFIDKCFVDENYRGKGYQVDMIIECLKLVKEKGSFMSISMVSPANETSLKNFELCGFYKEAELNANGFKRYILKNESFNK